MKSLNYKKIYVTYVTKYLKEKQYNINREYMSKYN